MLTIKEAIELFGRERPQVLTLWRPWGWAIIHAGKCYENRGWPTDYRGPLLIHAGKTFDADAYDLLKHDLDIPNLPLPGEFPAGGIIGVVDMVDCLTYEKALQDSNLGTKSLWLSGAAYAWKLANPRTVEFTPCRGRQKIWTLRPEDYR